MQDAHKKRTGAIPEPMSKMKLFSEAGSLASKISNINIIIILAD